MYYVYILVSKANRTLYTGQAADLVERIRRHNEGLVRATKAGVPHELGYFEILRPLPKQ